MIAITPIQAFNDNYFWAVHNKKEAIIVDPGDAEPVKQFLTDNQLNLKSILITHHHWDHTNGVETLKSLSGATVYAPKSTKITVADIRCQDGDEITLLDGSLQLRIIEVPGHTLDHIAYFSAKNAQHANLLFPGDTLFSGGCGRVFEGTPTQMWQSLQKLASLPEDTLIYSAHEYTLSNLAFAKSVEPGNLQIHQHIKKVEQLRKQHQPSLPTVLGTEKAINPFLRAEIQQVIEFAQSQENQQPLTPSAVFKIIRQCKDNF
ncbi:hydroxyacylglutathione hydrolase [Aliikangiella maris]|uniref:Hydroxyacylglutathione hydrolase n=2 Tax=Aliikangiella maris TaxID=3162458 RepID=A0ABV2BRU1_9GAMM